jgi:hypothetical protein
MIGRIWQVYSWAVSNQRLGDRESLPSHPSFLDADWATGLLRSPKLTAGPLPKVQHVSPGAHMQYLSSCEQSPAAA